METCQEQSTRIITVKPKNELNNFRFFVHKMTAQSFKLEKFMTNQAENLFGHISASALSHLLELDFQ